MASEEAIRHAARQMRPEYAGVQTHRLPLMHCLVFETADGRFIDRLFEDEVLACHELDLVELIDRKLSCLRPQDQLGPQCWTREDD